jgi:hypothetical protein
LSDEYHESSSEGVFDRALKWAMPNATVIRRYVAAGLISGAIFVMVSIIQIGKTEDNANRGAKAICAIIIYGENTLAQSPTVNANSDAAKRFSKLVHDMRATGVQCTPPPPRVP